MDSCELITLITAIACALTKCCSEDELSILAVSFTQLGDTLATFLTKEELIEKNKNNNRNSNNSNSRNNNNNKSNNNCNNNNSDNNNSNNDNSNNDNSNNDNSNNDNSNNDNSDSKAARNQTN